MPKYLSLPLLLASLLALAAPSHAQTSTKAPYWEPKPAAAPAPPQPQGRGGAKPGVEVKYDRFKDSTSVASGWMGVQGTPLDGLDMDLLLVYDGEKLAATPASVFLLIGSTSKDWQYLRVTPTLRAIVDGERMTLGEAKRTSSNIGRGYVTETLLLILTTKDLYKLAGAKKVEMQLGNKEFELSPEVLASFKAFAEHIKVK